MRKSISVLIIALLFLFVPMSFAYADGGGSCDPLDFICLACEVFCFPTDFATDEYTALVASSNLKVPFAYVNAALNFNTSDDFQVGSIERTGDHAFKAHLVNIPHDTNIRRCDLWYDYAGTGFMDDENIEFFSGYSGTFDTFCEFVSYPLNDRQLYIALEKSDGTILYTTPEVPATEGTYAAEDYGSLSDTVLPLTVTLASQSAIPAIGMPAQAGMTYTVHDDGQIHDFLFTYIRPIVTLLLWLILIGYFWIVAGRIFT